MSELKNRCICSSRGPSHVTHIITLARTRYLTRCTGWYVTNNR